MLDCSVVHNVAMAMAEQLDDSELTEVLAAVTVGFGLDEDNQVRRFSSWTARRWDDHGLTLVASALRATASDMETAVHQRAAEACAMRRLEETFTYDDEGVG